MTKEEAIEILNSPEVEEKTLDELLELFEALDALVAATQA